ncbi:MAG: TonB-dependent receptor [Alphaproteobacteria bacterium]
MALKFARHIAVAGTFGLTTIALTLPAFAAIDEIIVSARKRDESALSVPISVTAVPAAQLEKQGANDIEDLEGLAPNIVIDPVRAGPQGAAIAIRGVSFEDIEKSFDPAVGVVIDGVYIGTNTGQMVNFFDFESIEVLRGPQGTLFGKNTTGGVVNIRRSRPTGEFGIKAQVNYGSKERNDYRAVVNFPIWEDKIAGKAFFFASNFGGYYYNKTANETRGDNENRNYGLSLQFKPTSKFRALATIEKVRDWQQVDLGTVSRTPPIEKFLEVNNGQEIVDELLSGNLEGALAAGLKNAFEADLVCAGSNITTIFSPPEECDRNSDEDIYTTFAEIYGYSYYDLSIASLEMDYDITDDWALSAVTGWRKSNEYVKQDFDSSSANFFWTERPQDYEQFSQELRVQGPLTDWLHITTGLYYWYSWYQLDFILNTPLSPTGPIVNFFEHEVNAYAAFFDTDIAITDKLKLAIGGRYTLEEKKAHLILPSSGFTIGGEVDTSESWGEFTPKASLSYQLEPTTLIYGSYARGFRSGGFNGRAFTPQSVGPYEPEFVDTFEVGYKTLTFENRLALNAAAFYTDYTDKQEEIVRLVDGISGNPQETVVENVAGARIWGLEADATIEVFENFNLLTAIGYLNAEYLEFQKDLDGDGQDDDATSLEMRRTPSITWSMSGTYVIPVGRSTTALNVTYRYIDDYQTVISSDPDDPTINDRRLKAKAQNQLSANIAWKMDVGEGEIKASLWGRNLLNEKGLAAGLAVANMFAFAGGRPPRLFGAELSITY